MTSTTKSAQKKTATSPAKKNEANTFRVGTGDGITADMNRSQMLAVLTTASAVSAHTLRLYSGTGETLEVTDLLGELRKVGGAVSGGNLEHVEKMLVYQAITLDAMFNNLAQKADRAEHMKSMEVYLRLAMKAQSQSRATIETIGLLKNPAPYIKQANIAAGHQQVNNTYANSLPHTHAGNIPFEPNKLMEGQQHDKRLDMGAAATPGRADKALETVGAIDRTQDTKRQAKGG